LALLLELGTGLLAGLGALCEAPTISRRSSSSIARVFGMLAVVEVTIRALSV
jgi:hypothetical protein